MGYIVIWKGKKNVLEKFVLKYNENNIIHMVISVIESCEKRFLYCLCGIIAFMAFIAVLSQHKYCDSAIINSKIQSTAIKDNDSAAIKDSYSSESCFLDVSVGFGEKVVIPDPAKTDGKVSISLFSKKDVKKICDAGKWYKKNGDLYLGTDLSFAGFDRPVFVSSYAVGNITEKSGKVSYISKKTNKGIKKKKVQGSCLVLFVTTKLEKYEKYDESYFVILDYKNGVSYKKKTTFYLPSLYSRWVRLSVADVTGDGVQELLVSCLCNKSIEFGLYNADVDKHNIEEIYATYSDWEKNLWEPGWDFIDRLEFKGKLKDNYKAELMLPCIGYSKTISVIKDGGYREKSLHKKIDEWGCINPVGMWKKNGKLRKKWAKKHGKVFLYTLDDISYPKDKDGNIQIEFVRAISIGHRSVDIGNMHIYMQYDKDIEKLVVKNAKYSDYKKSKKEWKEARKKYGGFN